MAAYMRPGDRTFFVYDRSATKKEYDDPKDAIIYYFPQHTSIDTQCIFCNQLMGMVNCTKTIAGAPPKLYKLRKNKVATIHEGSFTMTLACKLRTPDSAVIRKLENLYKVFAFYHCSIAKVKQISGNNEAFLSNMAAIWDFYVPYVRRYGNTVPAIFEPIRSVQLLKGGNFQFLRCSHLLQWLQGQPSLLAGCILYKRSVLCTQLTPELTSHLLLIKPNQQHHPSKSITDTVLPFGVRIMSVYVTEQQYRQLSTPLQSLSKPHRLGQARQSDAFFYTPPASPTEKQNSEAKPSTNTQSTPKRMLERKISSTAGRLFSNFTGMLEGTVVESLWPSAPKSSSGSESPQSDTKRESLKDGSPRSTKDGCGDGVMLSRSSDDVVCALQGDGSSSRGLTGSACHDDQTPTLSRYGSSCSPRPTNHPDSSNSQISFNNEMDLSGVSPVRNDTAASNSTVCIDDRQKSLTGENRLTDSVLEAETRKDISSEQISRPGDTEESHPHTDADAINTSPDSSQRRNVGEDIVSENNDPLTHPSEFPKEFPNLAEQKSESPESGIGDCTVQRRGEDFTGTDRSIGEKDVRIYNSPEVISADGRPCSGQFYHNSTLCKDRESESSTVLHTEGDVKSTDNANANHCLNDAGTNAVLVNNSVSISAKGDVSLLNSRVRNADAIRANPEQNTCADNTQMKTCVERSSLTENSISSTEIVETSSTSSKIRNPTLEASKSRPDVLQSAKDELSENPDLLESSQINMTTAENARKADSLEDIDSNILYEKSETLLTASSPPCQTRNAEGKMREGATHEEIDSFWPEEIGETLDGHCATRRPTLKTDFSAQDQDREPGSDLVNVSLYVQAHSDTTLLFLAEKSITKEKDTLFQLWQSVLRELGELELQLKDVVRPERELDCKAAYNFIHFDNHQETLEGSITNPVNQVESVFCRGCQLTHEQFLNDDTLTDITLRNHQTVIYAHRNACHHTFFHKSYKSMPSPGIPSSYDSGFYNQSSCREAVREHNITLL